MSRGYRVGGCWGVTVVEFDPSEQPDDRGRRTSDRLLATAQTDEGAARIVAALNEAGRDRGR